MAFSASLHTQQPSHAAIVPKKYYSHGTSAQSQLAHGDEDWTLIADMTERRRIQNRIAQRSYRRRLKERLSRLEEHVSRVGSSSRTEKRRNSEHKDARSKTAHARTQRTKPQPHQSPPNMSKSQSGGSMSSYASQLFYYASSVDSTAASDSLASAWSDFSSQPMTLSYPDFPTMFDDPIIDYADTSIWRRATWPAVRTLQLE